VELDDFVDKTYREPYSLIKNNCFHKSIKIMKRARELGKDATLVICWSIEDSRIFNGLPPVVMPHMYTEVNGRKVDVTYDPDTEKVLCSNTERVTVLPIKLPRIGRSNA